MFHLIKSGLFVVFGFVVVGLAAAQTEDGDPKSTDVVHPVWESFAPEFVEHVCPFQVPFDYDTEAFRCGYVLVPEDRTNPQSRLIKLSVLQGFASTPEGRNRALVRLTGGPGGASIGRGRIQAYDRGGASEIRAETDVIFFDQRGTGYSERNICRAIPLPYQYGVRSTPDGLDRFKTEIKACFENAEKRGISLDGYTTWQNALDVRDIRLALGYDSWTLFGVSYGTELAQAVISVDPGGINAAILDSIVPAGYPTNDLKAMFASGFVSALSAVSDMCAADEACARKYDDLGARFVEAMKHYDENPLVLEQISHSKASNGTLYIDGELAASAVFQALYRRSIYPDLPALLHVLETRDEETFREYVNVLSYDIDHVYGRGMSLTMNCRGGFRETPDGPSPIFNTDSQMNRWMTTVHFYEGCENFFYNDPDPSTESFSTDLPVLLIAGSVDPITPPYYAEYAMPGLSNVTYVEFPHTGHGGLLSNFDPCGKQLIIDFIRSPGETIDTSCAAKTPAPEFLVSLRKTKAPYRFAKGLQEGIYPIFSILAVGALSLVLIGFPIGWIARKCDKVETISLNGGRRFAWFAALLAIGAAYWATSTIFAMATDHPASLPVGVPYSIALGGWLAVAAVFLSILAIYKLFNKQGKRAPIGTHIAVVTACLCSVIVLLYVWRIGASPF